MGWVSISHSFSEGRQSSAEVLKASSLPSLALQLLLWCTATWMHLFLLEVNRASYPPQQRTPQPCADRELPAPQIFLQPAWLTPCSRQ